MLAVKLQYAWVLNTRMRDYHSKVLIFFTMRAVLNLLCNRDVVNYIQNTITCLKPLIKLLSALQGFSNVINEITITLKM